MRPLNIFYAEPDPDRWLPLDRYPRRIARRLLRGKPAPGGQMRVFLNLCAGLTRIGTPYRINDYRHALHNENELICIVGKPCVLDAVSWKNPILFGAAVYSHPSEDPLLLERLPIKRVLVPGMWMKQMWAPYWGDSVEAWPVGIDTELWSQSGSKSVDILLYDKIRWERERLVPALLEPIRRILQQQGRSFEELRYGYYREEDFRAALGRCRAMIFLCEHETQGIAYLQALSCGVPVLAWDRGGYWRDPAFFPDKEKFAPVTSVPYWDARCGLKFGDYSEFERGWLEFWDKLSAGDFRPREYVLENLTLEKCAREYLEHCRIASG